MNFLRTAFALRSRSLSARSVMSSHRMRFMGSNTGSSSKLYDVSSYNHSFIDGEAGMESIYSSSIEDPERYFEAEAMKRIDWFKKPTTVLSEGSKFSDKDVKIAWFADGVLNASYNCLDRHVKNGLGEKVAFYWEPDSPDNDSREITYSDLLELTCRIANVLKEKLGVEKGDRVAISMPMVPEGVASMLACARIGAVHSVIFGGFSAAAVADRVDDAGVKAVITADGAKRGGKIIPLKTIVDDALGMASTKPGVLCFKNTHTDVANDPSRDVWYDEVAGGVAAECEPEPMLAEDPLFILYTSGSTGKPKGVLHTTGGYLLQASLTHKLVFDHRSDDVYWCTADCGWITGHSYITYGPLLNQATSVMYEGVPNYPTASRIWQICDKFSVTQCYTAPTAIRALMQAGDSFVTSTDRSSLRVLGTVGEPINPEAWTWFFEKVGNGRCPIVDTWWQTETGGIMMSNVPGVHKMLPGSCSSPLFGISPVLLDEDGEVIDGDGSGYLAFSSPWPGMFRTLWGDHERYIDAYFSQFSGYYFTGDRAKREDGRYVITGRSDDVMNVSGHRLGSAEIESALVAHPKIAEAAVCSFPHPIKGEGIYAFATPMADAGITDNSFDDALVKELVATVRAEIGPVASPDYVQLAPTLPKTRSGKIMRRILRKIAADDVESGFGDTSTLLDPEIVDVLSAHRLNRK